MHKPASAPDTGRSQSCAAGSGKVPEHFLAPPTQVPVVLAGAFLPQPPHSHTSQLSVPLHLPVLDASSAWSRAVCGLSSVCGLLHVAQCFQGPSAWEPAPACHPFLWPSNPILSVFLKFP